MTEETRRSDASEPSSADSAESDAADSAENDAADERYEPRRETVAHVDVLALGAGVRAMLHPDTLLNKVLVGYESGALRLWNVRSQRLVHTFAGWGSPVTVRARAHCAVCWRASACSP